MVEETIVEKTILFHNQAQKKVSEKWEAIPQISPANHELWSWLACEIHPPVGENCNHIIPHQLIINKIWVWLR